MSTDTRPRRPRWTKKRIRTSLRLAYGTAANGGIHTAAAAADLGISQRQLQRWIHGDGRETVDVSRYERLHELFATPQSVTRQERVDVAYARDAISALQLPRGRGVKPIWKTRRWIEPHLAAVIDLPDLGLRQVTLTRGSTETLTTLRRRGEIVDFIVVPTRFHATVLVNVILSELVDWRINPKAVGLSAGTRVIWAEAPIPDLSAAAHRLHLTTDTDGKATP